MRLEAGQGFLHVWLGPSLTVDDVARIQEAASAFGPSRLMMSFSKTRDYDPSALALLGRTLETFPKGAVVLHGITRGQMRLLSYLGVHVDEHGVHAG